MPDYNDGCIYKIKRIDDFNDDNIYIGSTCDFIRRKNQHKSWCCNETHKYYNLPLYKYIRNNGGWDNFIMIIIFPFKCNSKYELEVMERRVIDELEAKLNCYIPTRTQKERYITDHEFRDKKKEVSRQYYYNNKEEITEYNKQYRINNKEKFNKNSMTYYHVKKHIVNAPIECDNCGIVVYKRHLNRHKKSNYCINYKKND